MSMTVIPIPPLLHDVLGKQQTRLALLLISAAVAIALVATAPALADIALWRSVLAALLIVDIAAGAIANLTAGTNEHYATRSPSRWVFLAVHVHLPLLALLLGAPLTPALIAWAATISGGVIVNLLAGRAVQRVAAGVIFAAILCVLPILPEQEPTLLIVSSLFAFKVVYAFAVDHRADSRNGEVLPLSTTRST